MNRCLFLDRDGTLMLDTGYPSKPEEVVLLEHVLTALKYAKSLNYHFAIISNQSGVGRGYFDESAMWEVDSELKRQFIAHDVKFIATEYCTDRPDKENSERKPSPVMIERVAAKHDISLEVSWMIGDKLTDVEAGVAAGCKTILLGSDDQHPTCRMQTEICESWIAVTKILAESQAD